LSSSIIDYKNIGGYSDVAHSSGANGARSSKPSFFNVFLGHLPGKKASYVDETKAIARDRKVILNQMLESLRAESDSSRQMILTKLLQKDDDDKPFDIHAKCLDIARRIMRGEKVSAEEMRLLSRYFPELLFQALLLRQENPEADRSEDSPKENDARVPFISGSSEGISDEQVGFGFAAG